MRATNWTQGPLNEGPRPKSGKSRLNLNSTVSEGKSTVLRKKKKKTLKRRAHELKNQDTS
jgi:hypothetical protein